MPLSAGQPAGLSGGLSGDSAPPDDFGPDSTGNTPRNSPAARPVLLGMSGSAFPPSPQFGSGQMNGQFQAFIADFNMKAQTMAKDLETRVFELQDENAKLRAQLTGSAVAPPAAPGPKPPAEAQVQVVLSKPEGDTDAKKPRSSVASMDSAGEPRKAMTAREQKAHMQTFDKGHLTHKDEVKDAKGKKPKVRHLFTDIDEMKTQIRHRIIQPYSVTQYYKDTGICVRIASSHWFESLTLSVVSINSLWIAVDIDLNGTKDTKDKEVYYQVIEYAFFAYFMGEVIVRFIAFRNKLDCFKDFWFNFDSVLMVLMVVDTFMPLIFSEGLGFNTSIIRLARLVKISRMARIARLLNRWPELSVLIKGIGIAARSVTSCILLLLIMVYVFSVGFRFLTIDTEVGDKYFRSVLFGMKVLVLYATMPDTIDFVEDTSEESLLIGLVVVFFIILAALTLMNMLIGVICEVIGVVSAVEKEEARVHLVKDHLVEVLKINGIDIGDDDDAENKIISKQEFQDLLLDESVVKIMRGVGVDPIGLIDFIDYIFSGDIEHNASHGLTFSKLVELICSLGGSNSATVKDVVDMRQVMMRQLASIEDILEHGRVQNSSLSVPSQQMGLLPLQNIPSTSQSYNSQAGNLYNSQGLASQPMSSTPALEPADIDAFLKNAASIWVAQSRVGLRGGQGELSTSGSIDGHVELKATDMNGPVVEELSNFVKDLQTRLEQTQGEMKATRRQLDLFEGRQHTFESGLLATKAQIGSCEGRTQAMESAYSAFDGRAQAIETGLSSLRAAAELNPITVSPGGPASSSSGGLALANQLGQPSLGSPGGAKDAGDKQLQVLNDYRKDLEASIRGLKEQSQDLERRFQNNPGQSSAAPSLPRGSPRQLPMAGGGHSTPSEYGSYASGTMTPELQTPVGRPYAGSIGSNYDQMRIGPNGQMMGTSYHPDPRGPNKGGGY